MYSSTNFCKWICLKCLVCGPRVTIEKSEQAWGKEKFVVVLQEDGYIISRFLLGVIVMALIISRVLSSCLIQISLWKCGGFALFDLEATLLK